MSGLFLPGWESRNLVDSIKNVVQNQIWWKLARYFSDWRLLRKIVKIQSVCPLLWQTDLHFRIQYKDDLIWFRNLSNMDQKFTEVFIFVLHTLIQASTTRVCKFCGTGLSGRCYGLSNMCVDFAINIKITSENESKMHCIWYSVLRIGHCS